jgi:hypothetical protein
MNAAPTPILEAEAHRWTDGLARTKLTLLGSVSGLEVGRLLLSDADEHDAFVGSEAGQRYCSDAILLTTAEVDDRDGALVSEALDV